jgi:hypothetical protein
LHFGPGWQPGERLRQAITDFALKRTRLVHGPDAIRSADRPQADKA